MPESPVTGGIAGRRVETSLITNGVTWFLRSTLVADHTSVSAVTPRTVLGLIPVGVETWAVRPDAITDVRVGAKLHPDRLAAAAVLALLAIFADVAPVVTAILVVATVAMALVSFIAVLRIEVRDGTTRTVPICLIHIPRAAAFANYIADIGRESPGGHR